jgi:hypothetical protein
MAMRRYLVLSLIGVCLLVFVTGTSAFAGSSTYYAGTNSQGQKLFFSVDQTANGPAFDPFFTTMTDHCPATGNMLRIEFTFTGFEIPIKNGKFSMELNDISDRFTWSGTVTSTKASGIQFYDFPAFDNEGGLQLCATGSLSWTAKALVSASSKAAAPRANYVVNVTKESDGSVHYSITR